MAWTIQYAQTARKALRKLDKTAARRIVDYLDERIAASENPRAQGKALSGGFRDLWRYRVGDYRIVCDIQDNLVVVLVLQIGHRKDIYE